MMNFCILGPANIRVNILNHVERRYYFTER
jgi:hypothetical protein